MNYKIRFHLAKGVNFMKWQIKDTKSGEVIYISPKYYSLHFEGVTLKNSKSPTAKQEGLCLVIGGHVLCE